MAAGTDRLVQALGRAIATTPAASYFRAVPELLRAAIEREWEERRFFLWLPVCAGAGVCLYFAADHEPSLVYASIITLGLTSAAAVAHRSRSALVALTAAAAVASGFTAAALRTATVAHPVVDRIRILKLAGFAEEVDHRRAGARFILRITSTNDPTLAGALTRVRLTTRRSDPLEAGDAIAVTARLVPPSQAALPGGFNFARDAFYAGFDAVGSVLGRIRPDPNPAQPPLSLRLHAGVDRMRNALTSRVSDVLGGDTGAIGAAMVTGKRDLLSDEGRELIREAGIFHIITIAGVQMTLVAGLLFFGLRSGLAAIPTLALRFPIKSWAAAGAILGGIGYDVLTGSRVGTQRALLMTTIMLGAVVFGRRAFTMRNLAIAALAVILVEPETVLGASFELSFAAVAALVAVQEARLFHGEPADRTIPRKRRDPFVAITSRVAAALRHIGRLLVATVAATSATAPVMATNFHEISPYVVVGNPLTLSIIEFFAVPGALIGAVLYPLGLDRWVWHWVGWGIDLVLWAARLIAAAPGATLTVPAFADWALPCFALATCSATLWRSVILRCLAVPLFALGLLGTTGGVRYDVIVPPNGDAVAFRTESGALALTGKHNAFAAEQWLKADGDGRTVDQAIADGVPEQRCDALACVAHLVGGRTLSLVSKTEAFEEDCRRVDVIVTPLYAPASCAAELIVDRGSLAGSGAVGFVSRNGALIGVPARQPGEFRPWLPPLPRIPAVTSSPRSERSDPPPQVDSSGDDARADP